MEEWYNLLLLTLKSLGWIENKSTITPKSDRVKSCISFKGPKRKPPPVAPKKSLSVHAVQGVFEGSTGTPANESKINNRDVGSSPQSKDDERLQMALQKKTSMTGSSGKFPIPCTDDGHGNGYSRPNCENHNEVNRTISSGLMNHDDMPLLRHGRSRCSDTQDTEADEQLCQNAAKVTRNRRYQNHDSQENSCSTRVSKELESGAGIDRCNAPKSLKSQEDTFGMFDSASGRRNLPLAFEEHRNRSSNGVINRRDTPECNGAHQCSLMISHWDSTGPALEHQLHPGDELLEINDVDVRGENVKFVYKVIAKITSDKVSFTIKRAPHAFALKVTRSSADESLGSELKNNTIITIHSKSAVGSTSLQNKTRGFMDGSLVHWEITEINWKPVNIYTEEAETLLQQANRDIILVVQPSDLVHAMKNTTLCSKCGSCSSPPTSPRCLNCNASLKYVL